MGLVYKMKRNCKAKTQFFENGFVFKQFFPLTSLSKTVIKGHLSKS